MLDGKTIAVLVEEGYEGTELIESVRSMKSSGARVVIVGNQTGGDYRGQRGRTFIKADITADKANALDYDVIIVPGGHAPDKMRLHPSMIELVRTAYDSGKIVAAICHGPQLLVSAGIVSGRRMTSSPSIAVDLQNAGAEWVDYPVVRDGNIITSRKPADIPRFNKAIIVALQD